MTAVALVVAAGRGERLGTGGPKAFVMCGGRPLLEWSIDALKAVPEIGHIVVATPPGIEAPAGTTGVFGGEERSHSVRAALHHTLAGDPVLVHDAARPLVTPATIRAVLAGLDEDADAAIAAARVTDTIKVGADAADGAPRTTVTRTLDRSELWAIQTPQ
ncbi:MAG TPA: 2-C-methyl-D-erythritol 4-phosphate cytidylyltransferase, partial [Baekduia sp.]